MRKLLSYFCCLIIVFNQITTSANAASILQKTKIHEITSCESVLNSSFETYIECLNEQVFTSKHFGKLSKNKKNDIQSLLAIANILSENVEDGFLSKSKAVDNWMQIIKSPYKGKIKKKKLQEILEQTTCMDTEEYDDFIKCFSEEFRYFEIYKNSDLLNKRRIETIVSNARFLTLPNSKVFSEAKEAYQRGKTYKSANAFDYFFTYMNLLGTDYFKKIKSDRSWQKIITFIIIAIIIAYLTRGLMKSQGASSSSGVSSSATSGASSGSGCTSALVANCTSIFRNNIFRSAPSTSVLHKSWFKYGFSRGIF